MFSGRASTASADIAYEDVALPVELAGAADMGAIDLLFALGAVASKSEARRLIQQGGVEIEGKRVEDIGFRVPLDHSPIHMRVGKKRFLAVNL